MTDKNGDIDIEESNTREPIRQWKSVLIATSLGVAAIVLSFHAFGYSLLCGLIGYIIGVRVRIKEDGTLLGLAQAIVVFPAIFGALEALFNQDFTGEYDERRNPSWFYEAMATGALLVPAIGLIMSVALPLLRLLRGVLAGVLGG